MVWSAGGWQVCRAGMAYLAPAYVLHAYHAVAGEHWELCWVTFEEQPSTPSLFPIASPTLVPFNPQPLSNILLGLYCECIDSADTAAIHHWAALLQLHLRRLTPTRHEEDRLRRLWEHVDADLVHPWTLAELATLMNLSDEALRVVCQRLLGRSPMQQVTFLRMQRAAYLLRCTNWNIELIAFSVGYENTEAFSSAFKRWMGQSPTRYRRLGATDRKSHAVR